MQNEIITTLNNSIASIQLNLFDFSVEKPKFEKILNQRFQTPKIPRNANQTLNLLAGNHLEYINPVCPKCESSKVIK
jgi:hypothetical protein